MYVKFHAVMQLKTLTPTLTPTLTLALALTLTLTLAPNPHPPNPSPVVCMQHHHGVVLHPARLQAGHQLANVVVREGH